MSTIAEIKLQLIRESIEGTIACKMSENRSKPEVLRVLREIEEAVDLAFD